MEWMISFEVEIAASMGACSVNLRVQCWSPPRTSRKELFWLIPFPWLTGWKIIRWMIWLKNYCKLCSQCDHFALAWATAVSPNAPRRYLSFGI